MWLTLQESIQRKKKYLYIYLEHNWNNVMRITMFPQLFCYVMLAYGVFKGKIEMIAAREEVKDND